MLITTSNDLPGYEVVAVQGEVFGLTVRSRNIGAGCLAGLRSIGGGEIPEFTKLLSQSRNEAMARMVVEAQRRGSNAIIAMRFDSGAIGQWSEICAYGTACWVRPVSDAAQQQYQAMVQAGQMPHQQSYQTQVSEWGHAPQPYSPPQPQGQPDQPDQPGSSSEAQPEATATPAAPPLPPPPPAPPAAAGTWQPPLPATDTDAGAGAGAPPPEPTAEVDRQPWPDPPRAGLEGGASEPTLAPPAGDAEPWADPQTGAGAGAEGGAESQAAPTQAGEGGDSETTPTGDAEPWADPQSWSSGSSEPRGAAGIDPRPWPDPPPPPASPAVSAQPDAEGDDEGPGFVEGEGQVDLPAQDDAEARPGQG